MNVWRGTFSMTRPDLKMFGLLRENVFLKLPIHLYSYRYMIFLVNCKTAKNPMDVDNITDVAERVHRWHSPVQPSLVSANSGISIKQLCTRGPLGPGPRSLGSTLVTDFQRLKNTFIWNAQLQFSFSYQFAHACMTSFQVAFTPRLRGMNSQLWQVVWNISCLRWRRRLTLQPRDLKFVLPTWSKHRNETVQWHVPK